MVFEHSSVLPFSRSEVFRWFSRPGAFARLIPPYEKIISEIPGQAVTENSINTFKIRQGPLTFSWRARHFNIIQDQQFCDEQLHGPFAKWKHRHTFEPDITNPEHTKLRDHIEWEGPFSSLLTPFFRTHITNQLQNTFLFRDQRLKRDLSEHHKFKTSPRLNIGITGASGLIGRELTAFLTTGGHQVFRFVREPVSSRDEIHWDPAKNHIDHTALRQLDAVIHLAGENVAHRRWNESGKREILESRVKSTKLITESFSRLSDRQRTIITASAIGFYGNTDDQLVDEASPRGKGFLADVCDQWEKASLALKDNPHVRLHTVRIGVVLSLKGGALPMMVTPAKLGLAGKFGNGRQYISWISMDDVIYSLHRILMNDIPSSVINLVSPHPLTQSDFIHQICHVVGRPCFMNAPAVALRLLLGEKGQEILLNGQRVQPKALLSAGYSFAHPHLEGCLRFEMGNKRPTAVNKLINT